MQPELPGTREGSRASFLFVFPLRVVCDFRTPTCAACVSMRGTMVCEWVRVRRASGHKTTTCTYYKAAGTGVVPPSLPTYSLRTPLDLITHTLRAAESAQYHASGGQWPRLPFASISRGQLNRRLWTRPKSRERHVPAAALQSARAPRRLAWYVPRVCCNTHVRMCVCAVRFVQGDDFDYRVIRRHKSRVVHMNVW